MKASDKNRGIRITHAGGACVCSTKHGTDLEGNVKISDGMEEK